MRSTTLSFVSSLVQMHRVPSLVIHGSTIETQGPFQATGIATIVIGRATQGAVDLLAVLALPQAIGAHGAFTKGTRSLIRVSWSSSCIRGSSSESP
jgi:hypothetical protein